MKAIRRRITRFEQLAVGACGYESAIRKAIDARVELESFIQEELERLANKAGEL